MSVAVVRYNAGNISSVVTALERFGVPVVVTDRVDELQQAERVIFPGVGEASSAMNCLRGVGLDQVIRSLRAPVLGICLGLQLLCEYSEEGDTEGLGIIPGRVRRFTRPRKVPHIGWSRVEALDHPVFRGIPQGSYFYFVHSYRLDDCSAAVAGCEYEETFCAAAAKDNFIGVQFHPEKSAEAGERLLKNFLEWRV